jgi:hypothetical protein
MRRNIQAKSKEGKERIRGEKERRNQLCCYFPLICLLWRDARCCIFEGLGQQNWLWYPEKGQKGNE